MQERDNQIKMLSEQVEQYTTEMERNAVLIEELKKPLKKDKGHVSVQQRRLEDLSTKLQAAERRALEAERAAQLAEHDARDKDIELNDTLSRIRLYESVSLSLYTFSSVKFTPVTKSKSVNYSYILTSVFNLVRPQTIFTRSFS